MSENLDYIYTIGEVSEKLGVKEHTLRFWEKEFPFLKPKRAHNGRRGYSLEDVELLQQIKRLLYEQGYTAKGALKELLGQGNLSLQIEEEENLFASLESLEQETKFESVKTSNQDSPANQIFDKPVQEKVKVESKYHKEVLVRSYQKILALIDFWEKFDNESEKK